MRDCLAYLPAILATLALQAETPALFEDHCMDCHEEDNAKADFRIDALLESTDFDRDFLKWEDILTHLVDRSMPPRKKKTRPTLREYEATIHWLRENLTAAELVRAEKKPKWMRRLNRVEYNHTIRDLFGIQGLTPADQFPADDALHGFDNVAEGLNISPLHLQNYLDAAYSVLDKVLIKGKEPQPRTTLYRRTNYNPGKGIQPIKAKSGNMWFNQYWIGNAWHIQHRFKDPGTYRFTIRATPSQFNGKTAGFITTVNGRDAKYWDVLPTDSKPFTIVQIEVPLHTPGSATVQIRWTENENGLGTKRPGQSESQSPFRKLQAAKKKFPQGPDEAIVEHLGWPVFEDLEVTVEGPLHSMWPPPYTAKLLSPAEGREDFQPILAAFLPQAFRRLVTAKETQHYAKIAQAELEAGEPWPEALKHALVAALVSPHFLFLMETPPPDTPKGEYQLNPFELASRLSYFLWSTMPDDTLFQLAKEGRLQDPGTLASEVARMLTDPKAASLTSGFGEQWLSTRRIPALMPEPSLFKHRFDHHIHRDMAREPIEFFDYIRRNNAPLTDFLDSPYALLNGTMARHYGIPGVEGQTFRKVALQDRNRGGLLTQAGYLALTSEATRTSPVKRGIWILEHLFHRPPPPPPPNVEPLEAQEDNAIKSMTERLALHQNDPQCASCHIKIDPWGLALERFDAIGGFREKETVVPPDQVYLPRYKQKPVVFKFPEAVTFDDGTQVQDIPGYKKYLLTRKDEFARGFIEQMMVYALGRELLVRDQPTIDRILAKTRSENYHFHTILREIVQSQTFQTR